MAATYRLDLHTHSVASPDGSLKLEDYRSLLAGGLDYIAITDHNRLKFAREARSALGERIIIGEEVSTREGDVVGLFLLHTVPPNLNLIETIRLIHGQGGVVYAPHPFETQRRGLSKAALDKEADHIDIIEVFNGRAFMQNKSPAAKRWAAEHRVAGAAASDAHGRRGWGKTYTVVAEPPTAENLPALLADAELVEHPVGLGGIFYPKLNRLRKRP